MRKSTNKATVPPGEYNNYYVSLAENLLKCRAKSTEELLSLTQLLYCNISHSNNTVFSFSPITESKIYKAIEKLKNNKIGSFGYTLKF